MLVAAVEPPVVTERVDENEAKLHAGVAVGAPPETEMPQAGVTVIVFTAPPVNVQDGVTVMPTGVPVTAQVAAQLDVPLMVKEPAPAPLHTKTGPATKAARVAGLVPPHPLMENVLVEPASNHTGEPIVSVPTAA